MNVFFEGIKNHAERMWLEVIVLFIRPRYTTSDRDWPMNTIRVYPKHNLIQYEDFRGSIVKRLVKHNNKWHTLSVGRLEEVDDCMDIAAIKKAYSQYDAEVVERFLLS